MDALSLLIGSGLTILGGYLSNAHRAKLAHDAEIRKARREKLEQLASLAVSIDDWLERFQEDMFAVPCRHTPSEPMDQMYMISALYFPEVSSQVHLLCRTARELCQCIRREASRRLGEKTLTELDLRQRLEEYGKEYVEIHKRILEKQEDLTAALRSIADKFTT